jgi:hypothetical protein
MFLLRGFSSSFLFSNGEVGLDAVGRLFFLIFFYEGEGSWPLCFAIRMGRNALELTLRTSSSIPFELVQRGGVGGNRGWHHGRLGAGGGAGLAQGGQGSGEHLGKMAKGQGPRSGTLEFGFDFIRGTEFSSSKPPLLCS